MCCCRAFAAAVLFPVAAVRDGVRYDAFCWYGLRIASDSSRFFVFMQKQLTSNVPLGNTVAFYTFDLPIIVYTTYNTFRVNSSKRGALQVPTHRAYRCVESNTGISWLIART